MKTYLLILMGFCCLPLDLHAQTNEAENLLELTDLLYVDELQVANDTLQRLNLVGPEGVEDMPLFVWIGGGAWA